jgi:hypothetical protein
MSWFTLGVDDIATLVRARDICESCDVDPHGEAAAKHLTALLHHAVLEIQ